MAVTQFEDRMATPAFLQVFDLAVYQTALVSWIPNVLMYL